MFGGIGTSEILIVLVIALIVIGPKKLPEVARTIGRGLAELRRASYDLQRTLSLEGLDDAASRPPDRAASERLHQKTSADQLEVSGTPRRPGAAPHTPNAHVETPVEPRKDPGTNGEPGRGGAETVAGSPQARPPATATTDKRDDEGDES